MKKTINLAFLYAILAMIGGVFYREFTKLSGIILCAHPFVSAGNGYVSDCHLLYQAVCHSGIKEVQGVYHRV